MSPKVTVLLPVFDGGPYLRGAIDSVLAQTFDDFELLIVDDASRDDSIQIVESYADPRIRLLRNEQNAGQVASINRGVREAKGVYVARLDQDDRCLPARLERQAAVLDAEPEVAVVGGWVEIVDGAGAVIESLEATIDDFPEFVFLILAHRVPLSHPAVMFRRDEVIDAGSYDESFRLAEDQDLWRRLALRRREARIVREPLLRYLVHEGQQSQRRYGEQLANSLRSLDGFIGALSDRAPATDLRLLFTFELSARAGADADALRRATSAYALFLEDAGRRLELSDAESAKLDRLLRRHVYDAAVRSWRAERRARRAAPALARFGAGGEPSLRRIARRTVFRAVFAATPLLRVLRRTRHGSGSDAR